MRNNKDEECLIIRSGAGEEEGDTMWGIKLHHISIASAEELLTEIWNCLELYDIPSPHIAFHFNGPDDISLQVRFPEEAWAEIIERQLSLWRFGRTSAPKIRKSRKRAFERPSMFEYVGSGRVRQGAIMAKLIGAVTLS